MSCDHPFRKQAVRLLNPFRGVMNIIAYEGAEAVTIDGVHWDIYVKDMSLTADLDAAPNMLISEIRYGHWTAEAGLKRGPIYPSDDFDMMEAQGNRVYQYLLEHYKQTPFPLTDSYELWLLDQHQMPLALLSSTYSEETMLFELPLSWTSGNACKQFFQSASDGTDNHGLSIAEYLESRITRLAGKQPSAQWFRREASITQGLTGIQLSENFEGRQLDNHHFPEFFVRGISSHNEYKPVFCQYLNFLAPYLLTLPTLTRTQRVKYEQEARKQAMCVNKLYKLYPYTCNKKHINAARVEARLRKDQSTNTQTDNTLSPEYVELGISRTN